MQRTGLVGVEEEEEVETGASNTYYINYLRGGCFEVFIIASRRYICTDTDTYSLSREVNTASPLFAFRFFHEHTLLQVLMKL